MKDRHFEFPVLIGDIGGTNARFCLIQKDGQEQNFDSQAVANYTNIDEAIINGILPYAHTKPKALLLAIAGPVQGEVIPLTNSHWRVKPRELLEKLNLQQFFVINDFEAQALSTTALEPQHLYPIGPLTDLHEGSRVIMGPGTGLGVAGMTQLDSRYAPIAGEGGHVDYAAQTPRDLELLPFLQKIDGRVSAEELLSGRGLFNIYNAICAADGVKPKFTSPKEITDAAHNLHEQQVQETIQFFICYLARLAGDFAMTFNARGGIFIAGGITPIIYHHIHHQEFRTIFENKAPHQQFLQKIPTFIITHPRAALVGMSAFVRYPEQYIINKTDNFWQA